MKLIYVAGPFTADSPWEIESNIREAEIIGFQICTAGAMPVIPHANTRFFHGSFEPSFFYAGTLELLRRCDAVFLMPGWRLSRGARDERAEALGRGMPIFSEVDQLAAWLEDPHAWDAVGVRKGGIND